jgi:hypothetical protein
MQPSSKCNLSFQHIQTPATALASFSLAKRCTAIFTVVASSRMVVLTTHTLPGASQFIPSDFRPCSCSFLTTLQIGAPEEGFWCSSFSLLLHALASVAVNRCCLESKITGASVRPDSLTSAPRGVVGSAPRMDLACQLRRSWTRIYVALYVILQSFLFLHIQKIKSLSSENIRCSLPVVIYPPKISPSLDENLKDIVKLFSIIHLFHQVNLVLF